MNTHILLSEDPSDQRYMVLLLQLLAAGVITRPEVREALELDT